ncbi:MAG: zinc-dependent metalloprotease [Pseudomonadota bacterium]
MLSIHRVCRFLTLLVLACGVVNANEPNDPSDDFTQQTNGLTLVEGFFETYADQAQSRILAALPAADQEGTLLRFIHALRLTRGLGSNPLGLDRGWGNSARILRFRRMGDQVLLEAENLRYRADTDNPLERNAVAESFAVSFIWTTDVLAEADDGRVLIDLSDFLTHDELGLGRRLSSDGGRFNLAEDRSLPDTDSLLVFPDNVEIDAWVTFTGDEPGRQINATAADPNHVTLVQHHSFVRLPDGGYRIREADPRAGVFEQAFRDFAAPLDEAVVRSFAIRHRLQYVEPGRPESGIKEPIVFHIDPGAPAQIRDALIDGAEWWADAFTAAGFEGGYRVELLPEDAHPLDIRYNVVQWVHRQTRGWSYGGGIIDPRTGEMLKGHVILGSQRVRQDRMIFEGLAGTAATGTGRDDDPVELSLDRIRQLSAHEIGHALGFGHNFAASSNDRASVMDYPAPWIRVRNGAMDFSRAYDEGIGDWDKATTRWLYAEFPPGTDETAALDAILTETFDDGLLYIADEHGRSVGTAHPAASVWDNGGDAIAELEEVMAVRAHALERFGPDRLAEGRPMAELQNVIVPIYLYHRYQIDAAAKSLGGVRFEYGKLGQPYRPPEPVTRDRQRRALNVLLDTLSPEQLDLPDSAFEAFAPGTRGFGFSEAPPERLASRTAPAFDLFTAAETAADITLNALLNPRRAERLVRQGALDDELPSLDFVMAQIEDQITTALRRAQSDRGRVIAQRVIARYAAHVIELDDQSASAEVKAAARAKLRSLTDALPRNSDPAFEAWISSVADTHLSRPATPLDPLPTAPTAPPGSPIGSAGAAVTESCWHCGSGSQRY